MHKIPKKIVYSEILQIKTIDIKIINYGNNILNKIKLYNNQLYYSRIPRTLMNFFNNNLVSYFIFFNSTKCTQ